MDNLEDGLTLDERFHLLLHKKLMNKRGSAFRRAKKYYTDQYRKTGIIPGPLLLAGRGVMEGRRCSGRPRSLDAEVRARFVAMVKASCNLLDPAFVFITRRARTLKNYHHWLESELKRPISIDALRRTVKRENLTDCLTRPDIEEDTSVDYYFDPVPVFDLIQMDGCQFQYLKIRDENDAWAKPRVIEIYDTGARYLFALDEFFAESNFNGVDLFTQFLSGTPFPQKKIRFRPDNAKGFVNLKRVLNAVNQAHSVPGGFFLDADFSRPRSPKDKPHLESSHRGLHNFEIRVIKAFEHRIVKTEPGCLFRGRKKEMITVTFLDISLQELRASSVMQEYCREHNTTRHYFSEKGSIRSWVPEQRLDTFLKGQKDLLEFTKEQVNGYMKYGFVKVRATVSPQKLIRHKNRIYSVTEGAGVFSSHKSTRVMISSFQDKLFIFEPADNGTLLGEAVPLNPPEKKAPLPEADIEKNEFEQIVELLESHAMTIDRQVLIDCCQQGLSLERAHGIVEKNNKRYTAYRNKVKQPDPIKGMAVFNAFILDCQAHHQKSHVAPYATHGDTDHGIHKRLHQ